MKLLLAAMVSIAAGAANAQESNPVSARPSLERGAFTLSPQLAELIGRHAQANGVPVELARRVIAKESGFNPAARSRSYWGLMQLRYETARGMGYRGPAAGLLDAETNLRYGMAYLGNAYMVSGGDQRQAMRLYASGYYYVAKRKGLLARLRTANPEPRLATR